MEYLFLGQEIPELTVLCKNKEFSMNYIFVFIALLFAQTVYGQVPVIISGTPANMTYLNAHPEVKTIAYKFPSMDSEEADAFTNFGSGDIYYALYSDLQIRSFNLATNQYLGGWALGRGNPCLPGTPDDGSDCSLDWFAGRWGPDEVLEKEVAERYQTYIGTPVFAELDAGLPGLGCLGQHPLKYGDLDLDGTPELILYLEDTWMVFSTSKNKVIFAAMLDVRDWLTEAETIEHFKKSDHTLETGEPRNTSLYAAGSSKGWDVRGAAGYRGYAKLFFGDFDNDGVFDILVWRKLYQSRLVGDPVAGFVKRSDTWVHYTLNNGEYKKQPTPAATIKDWLTTNNLTWQKGYPSQSECAGEEGQLIKEMHDPLLNDPDVLQ